MRVGGAVLSSASSSREDSRLLLTISFPEFEPRTGAVFCCGSGDGTNTSADLSRSPVGDVCGLVVPPRRSSFDNRDPTNTVPLPVDVLLELVSSVSLGVVGRPVANDIDDPAVDGRLQGDEGREGIIT